MNRRQLIKTTYLGIPFFFSGCSVNGAQEGDEDSYPSKIVDWDFETNIETEASADDDPIIFIHRDKATILVEGVAWYGKSQCKFIDALSPEYDEETATLSVKVVDKRDEDKDCEAGYVEDAAADSYRMTVRFGEGVPRRIDAEHPWDHKTIEFSDPGATPVDISE